VKILIYIETHPIRNSYYHYYNIAEHFICMLEDEFINKQYNIEDTEVKLLVSRRLYNELRKNFNKNFIDQYVLQLLVEEEEQLEKKYFEEWNSVSIKTWKQLLDGEGEVAAFYEGILNRVHSSCFGFDVVAYWGTNGAVKNFSYRHNIPAIGMEQGCVRSPFFDSMYFDFIGVNGQSYVNFVDVDNVNKIKSIHTIDMFCHDVASESFQKSKYGKVIEENLEKNILIPLQLADDANIIQYSSYTGMLDLLTEVLPTLNNAGYVCYVKPHPGNVNSEYNSIDHKKCEEYIKKFTNVYWLNDIDYSDYKTLLSKMKAIVTINSSVGFEAMLMGKIIIPLGKSPYNISSCFPTISTLIENKINLIKYKEDIEKIIKLLLYNYLHLKNRGFSFTTFVQAIKLNVRLEKLFRLNKHAFIEYIVNNDINDSCDFGHLSFKNKPKGYLYKKSEVNMSKIEYFIYRFYQKPYIRSSITRFKKIPLMGRVLLYIKNKILAWK